jgi:Zn-dependent protease with chaperone function
VRSLALSKADPKSAAPVSLRANLRRSFWKGFILPGCVLVFFALAPAWLDHRLHGEIAASVNASSRLDAAQKARQLAVFEQLDFAEVCRHPPPGLEALRADFEEAGICAQFDRLHWGFLASLVVVGTHLGVIAATLVLSRRARGSHDALIAAYRTGWRLTMASALVQTLLLVPLLGYGSYELSTLAMDRYFPQLILLVVVGGVVGLWRCVSILLRRVPLDFTEPLAREVTPAEAPELWRTVRSAAERMRTAPPDHIVVGLQLNFYVTELTVKHATGAVTGRTLFLSQPLMKQLSPDEVLAIVGHELGHFLGDDTRITREFYPLRQKAEATMLTLAQAGWSGWTSAHVLNFFGWCFGSVEQAMSRQRELLADRQAAQLTTPTVVARALVRLHVFLEAFKLAVEGDGPGARPADPYAVPLVPLVRERLVPKAEFWTQLFERKAPHPLDSHPALIERLAALGTPIGPDEAIALATTETETGYTRWLEGRDHLFTAISQEAAGEVAKVRSQVDVVKADYQTPEGRELLERHFPEKRWPSRPTGLRIALGALALGMAVFVLLASVAEGAGVKALIGLVAAGFLAAGWWVWRRHHGAELVLRADSIGYGGWTRPLPLSSIESISALRQYGSLTLRFRLKQNERPPWKYALLPFRQRVFSFDLRWVQGRHDEILQTIHRYLTRQLGPTGEGK